MAVVEALTGMSIYLPSRRLRLRFGRAFILVIAPFVASPAMASVQDDEQLWLQANTHVPLAPGLRVTVEQIARLGDRANGLFQTEFGGIVGYRISKHIELGAGYRHVGIHNNPSAPDEDRVRQHMLATYGRWFFRFRVDERFSPSGDEIGFRVRPLIRYNYPLRKDGLALFASHETFYLPNGTNWGQKRGYDRMRNLIGLVVPFSRVTSADIGYLNQYRLGRNGSRPQMDHALSIQLTVNLGARPAPHPDD